jgi:hypothetical protein
MRYPTYLISTKVAKSYNRLNNLPAPITMLDEERDTELTNNLSSFSNLIDSQSILMSSKNIGNIYRSQ